MGWAILASFRVMVSKNGVRIPLFMSCWYGPCWCIFVCMGYVRLFCVQAMLASFCVMVIKGGMFYHSLVVCQVNGATNDVSPFLGQVNGAMDDCSPFCVKSMVLCSILAHV